MYGHGNKNLLSVYPFLVCNVYKYGSALHMFAGKKNTAASNASFGNLIFVYLAYNICLIRHY